MSRRIVRRPRAREDIVSIALYLEEKNPQASRKFVRAVTETQRALLQTPRMGVRRSFGVASLKEMRMFAVRGFSNLLIFYLPSKAGIEIVRVLHGARDIERLFGDERHD